MGTRVLMIDDDRAVIDMLQLSFILDGYEVFTASNGIAGLEMARAVRPDVVVLDVMMPGMDGLEVVRQLRSDPALACTPIVIVSARASTDDQWAGWQQGIDSYITKPFDVDVLLAEIERVVGASAANVDLPQAR